MSAPPGVTAQQAGQASLSRLFSLFWHVGDVAYRGPLIPALVATAALPVLFAPVRHQGRWLVDGGALNNLPVDIVRQMGADRVLGVDVPPSLTLSLEEERSRAGSLRGLLHFGNGALDWKLPFLVAEVSMGMTVQVIDRTRLALCPPDLLLEIDLPNVGLLAIDRSAEIVESGRKAAMERASELAALQTSPLRPRWQRRLSRIVRRLRRAWTVLQRREEVLFPGSGQPGRLPAELRCAGVCSIAQRGAREWAHDRMSVK
jgi:predicted acylesterase/phospholipase RssA